MKLPKVIFSFIFSIVLIIFKAEKVFTSSNCSLVAEDISPNTGVSACSNSLQNQLIKTVNYVLYSPSLKPDIATIDICEDVGSLSTAITTSPVLAPDTNCDYSFVVLIIANRNGSNITIGQGVVSDNCTILTQFNLIITNTIVWVKFKNGETFLVRCYEAFTDGSAIANTLLVRLFLELNSWSCTYKPPKYSPGKPLGDGYIITRKNCSSTDYNLLLVRGILIYFENDVPAVKVSRSEDICISFSGSVFVDYNGIVNGIFTLRSTLVFQIVKSTVLTSKINYRCILNLVNPYLVC